MNKSNSEFRKTLRERARHNRKNPTPAEALLWSALRRNNLENYHFYRQHILLNRFIVDFCCPKAKLIIEVDGSSHIGKEEYDEMRDKLLEEAGFRVLHYSHQDVMKNLQGVVDGIRDVLHGSV
jgi:very-short-patch-repair endonuclease